MTSNRFSHDDFEPVGGVGMQCEAQPEASRPNPQRVRRSLLPQDRSDA